MTLAKLSHPATFNKNVRPVCLPRSDDLPPVGQECTYTGWGMHPGKETINTHSYRFTRNLIGYIISMSDNGAELTLYVLPLGALFL